MEDVQ